MAHVAGPDRDAEPVPGKITVRTFRHSLEAHHPGSWLFQAVLVHLEAQGLRIARGTLLREVMPV